MSVQRVLLLGASGLTGRYCLDKLLSDNRVVEVKTLTRRPLDVEHEKLNQTLFQQTDGIHDDLFSVDTVICCLGTTLKKAGSKEAFRAVDFTLCVQLAKQAAKAGVATFSVISAVNAKANSVSLYARTKGQLEQALRALKFPQLIIAQPSLLLGERADNRFFEDLGQRALRPLTPLMAKLMPASTPISAEQLAAALVNASLQPDARGVVVLRYNELCQWANKST